MTAALGLATAGCGTTPRVEPDPRPQTAPVDELPICIVSHTPITDATCEWRYLYRGRTYYFCSEECLERFKRDPEYYVTLARR
ncbi:MAG: YHS domain-containing protein [Planctomycetes bacterium]|nr:YHS domain-containing protein [Planctomycetota bacterium]